MTVAVNLSPTIGVMFQAFNTNGLPLNAGKIYTYATGTTTPQATYTTSAGAVQNANPIVLGTDGRPPNEVWLINGDSYTFKLTDSLGNTIATYDNISGINDLSALSALFVTQGVWANLLSYCSAGKITTILAGTQTDVTTELQAAVDAVCPTAPTTLLAGGVLLPINSKLLITSTLDCTNSRVNGTKIRDGLKLLCNGGCILTGQAGAGKAVIETTGSQWLTIERGITVDTTLCPTPASASTIGVQQAVGSVLTSTLNQVINCRITMATGATANGNLGTVALWNFGAEESTYGEPYYVADVCQVVTNYNDGVNNPGTGFTLTSFQTLASTAGVSTCHWRGHGSLITNASTGPALILQSVVAPTFDNLYLACGGGTAPANGLKILGNISGAKGLITLEHFASVDLESYIIDSDLQLCILNADNPATTVNAGSFVAGRAYRIKTVGTTNFIAIGASANTIGYGFIATGIGSGSGVAYQFTPILSLNMANSSGLINTDVKIDIQSNAATTNDNVRPVVSTSTYDETTAGSGGLTYSRITAHAAGALGANLYIPNNIAVNSGKVLTLGAPATPADPTFQVGLTSDTGGVTGDGTVIDLSAYAWAGAGSFCRANDATRVYVNPASGQFYPPLPGDYEIFTTILLYNTTNAFLNVTSAQLWLCRSSAGLGNQQWLVDSNNPAVSFFAVSGVNYCLLKGSAIIQVNAANGGTGDYIWPRIAVGGDAGHKYVGVKAGASNSSPYFWQTRMEGRSIRAI